MKPLVWMRAIRDLGELPASRLAVLWALALRMDASGIGFASTRQLADDASVSLSTVERATRWARRREAVTLLQRGHRLGDGRTMASRWQLMPIPQPVTSDTLSQSQPVRTTSQPVTGVSPEVSIQEFVPHPSYVPTGTAPVAANGGRQTHQNEPNARRAIATLVAERALPFTADRLLDLAYTVAADPWTGYLTIKASTEQSFNGARDPVKVLHARLGLRP